MVELIHPNEWREGSAQAVNEPFGLVNSDLRRLAHYLVKCERKGNSMQATESRPK